MSHKHDYELNLHWTGNLGLGTISYDEYGRDFIISGGSKPELFGSSDPAFRGDTSKYNPEELLLAALSSCHMLWVLHLCADSGIIVVEYKDKPKGVMIIDQNNAGAFKEVILCPELVIKNSDRIDDISKIHAKAAKLCFIANSVNFPVIHRHCVRIAE